MAIVAIFGGSNNRPGEQSYEQAFLLGELLAKKGHIVMTGGYIGTMEAASRGAAEAGGHVIGVTCAQIESWRKVSANPWVKEEIYCQNLYQRLETLMNSCDAALVMPGGPGTLAEVSLMWDLLLIEAIPLKPLILIGTGWENMMKVFFKEFDEFIPIRIRDLITIVPNNQSAITKLNIVI
jgi:uncharacterized protein (TIGR00725 family)